MSEMIGFIGLGNMGTSTAIALIVEEAAGVPLRAEGGKA